MAAWLSLYEAALEIIDEAERSIGAPVDWTIGGGTMLYWMYEHRRSKDIDIFVMDAQLLGGFSPRLNEAASRHVQARNDAYVEQSNYVKLLLDEGEIDFIVAPRLTSPHAVRRIVGSRAAMVETAAEILAKKIFYRASDFTARDIFDTAFLIENGTASELVRADPAMYLPKLETILTRIELSDAELRTTFGLVQAVAYTPSFEECVVLIRRFVAEHRHQH